MRFDKELAELANLLRVGAETARMIAGERARDEAVIHKLAAQADLMAKELDRIVGDEESDGSVSPQFAATFRLRRDR